METAPPTSLGALLLRTRKRAELTQEALAERAGVSVNTISNLETGRGHLPRQATLDLLAGTLAEALALDPLARTQLLAACREAARAARAGRSATRVGGSTAPDSGSGRHGPEETDATHASAGLTFLMTDIEGSTPLWERHEQAMRVALARHDRLLDERIAAHGGRRVRERGEGDSVFAVFARPAAALAAAVAIQQAMLAEPWPAETPIRVRVGLHSGTAEHREGDYYGTVVNRCARIRGLGHGGQILLSAATVALSREALPPGGQVRLLGAHRLKGLAQAEEVYQLLHPALPAAFPPLRSPQTPRQNLAIALTSFVGREREIGQVLAMLDRAPLVTLTGSGGVGKTRLALQVADELADAYPDGVWLVDLAALADPDLVPRAAALAIGLREAPNDPLIATLSDYLVGKRALLMLDNCEHLVAACAAPEPKRGDGRAGISRPGGNRRRSPPAARRSPAGAAR